MQTIANSAHTIENSKVWRLGKKALTLQPEIFKSFTDMKKLLVLAALMMTVLTTEAQTVKYTINGISSDNGKIVVRGLRAQSLQDKLKQIFGE